MIIIGKIGRYITEENALDQVFAYKVLNDGSLRDCQRKTHQRTPGKTFDQTGAIGPLVVAPKDLPASASGLKIDNGVGAAILQRSKLKTSLTGTSQSRAFGYTLPTASLRILSQLVSQPSCFLRGLRLSSPRGACFGPWSARWLPTRCCLRHRVRPTGCVMASCRPTGQYS
ncbi:fumarylacetoacetate hydrolase family protein [Pseudorhodobacter wandonensis]|uniref:fumarylacetoacetate hydrolase family protein n=1 Tax=Pseudorhodobacter wandonensis TaxID=1120568 RepID=UPI001E2E2FD9|nr:fumarylacetoacetate hydrolase family protein [Pseudorhodobacter wandonensis]